MNVSLEGAILLGALFFLQCLSEHTTKHELKPCQRSLLNHSDIDLNGRNSSFRGAIEIGSKESRFHQLVDGTSIILVSKFHQTQYNIGLIPKFIDLIPSLTGILLHSAVSEKRLDIFNTLIYIGADVDVPNRHGITPLYKAITKRQYEMISKLLKCGADPNFSFKNISLLHNSVLEGDLNVLQALIELGAGVDPEDSDGKTPLYYALTSNKKDAVNKLLESGAKVNFKSGSGKTLMHKAVLENVPNIVKYLVELGVKIDEADNDGITPLYISLMLNFTEITDLLIDNGANINFVSGNGDSLVHRAVSSKSANILEHLLSLGSNQMMVDQEGLTPLYRAIKEDNPDIINILVRDKDILNKRPHTSSDYPLHFAVSNGSYSSVKLLLEKGANRYIRNKEDLFPLGLAIAQNKTDIVQLLLAGEPEIRKSKGILRSLNIPLHMAVSNGNIYAAKYLLEFGAPVNGSNKEGKSLLALAVEKNDVQMIDMLVKNGANITTKNEQGDSLLHVAVLKGAVDSVKVLVELGLDVEAVNNHGFTPLSLAISANSPKLIRYLISKGANVNRKLQNGQTPLMIAISNGTFPIITTLIALGAKIDGNQTPSPIEKAVEADRTDVIKLFVSRGVPLGGRNISLLHLAAESGSVNAIKTLLNMGLPVDTESLGYTPIWSATKKNRPKAMEVLLQSGANINEMANPPFSIRGAINASWSLLHEAVYKNFANATLVLLEHGIDPNYKDFRSWTPLHYAAIMNNFNIAKILIENGADVLARTNHGLTALGIVSYSQEASKQGLVNLLKSKTGQL